MHPADHLPSDIREAIGDGWSGVTMVSRRGGREPILICAAPLHRLGSLQGGGLTLEMPTVSSARGSRVLRIRLDPVEPATVAAASAEMVLDLAFPEARDMVERTVDRGGIDLMWVASEPPHPAAVEHIELHPDDADALASAAARAGEWHIDTPLPLGLDDQRWRRAARDAPAFVEAGTAGREVMLVVPAATLAGLCGRQGRVCFVGGGGSGWPEGELVVRFQWGEGLDEVERHAHIALHLADQRRLVARLSRQRSLLVLGAGRRFAPGPCVRVTLTAPARALLACQGLPEH